MALLLSVGGCEQDFEKLSHERSARGSLGEEVYKSLCRRVAGTEFPQDLDGRESQALCLGDADTVASELEAGRGSLPPRMIALAERRARVADAVDTMMPERLGSDLEALLRDLIPFYEPPNDLVPQNSRQLAALMRRLVESPAALRELARAARSGMLPPDAAGGLLSVLGGHDRMSELLTVLVPALLDGAAASDFATLRGVLALELATADAETADERRRREKLERSAWFTDESGENTFRTGTPLLSARRDAHGLPVPRDGVPYPFLDEDGDGAADLDGDRLAVASGYQGALPEPFPVVGEAEVVRDRSGRACGIAPSGAADCTTKLYTYTEDRDGTFFAGATREAYRLAGEGGKSVLANAMVALPGLIEPQPARRRRYGDGAIEYPAIDRVGSALLELVRAAGAAIPSAAYGESLALSERVMRELEGPIVRLSRALAEAERASRPDDDAYPGAELAQDHTFWDDLLWQAEKLSRRRLTADGEGALEAMSRATLGMGRDTLAPGQPVVQLIDRERLQHQGALLATFMRFKDEWRLNPRGDSERGPDEPLLIGAFQTPVDRSLPDSPASCGKDGCGGLIAGTSFEPYGKPNQNCVVQRAGRPASGRDCGEPANQSILQRSMGLLWEMAGRGQCNKAISLTDLLNFVNEDPCEVLDPPVACASDAECSEQGGADYACDEGRGVCFALPTSQTCTLLKLNRQREVDDTAEQAATALAEDYVCHADLPDAPCHAYEARFPAAFLETDDDPTTNDAAVQPCDLLNLVDVGRTFGRVLTYEYTLEIPNPWVRRYLEDVARASPARALPACDPDFVIEDPAEVPDCVPEAAGLTRDFYESMPPEVDTLGELVEFLLDDSTLFATDEATADLRPDPTALSHVLFKAPEEGAIPLFDALLMRGAPKTCAEAPGLTVCPADDTEPTPAGGCCIADLNNAPLRYRLDTYYGATSIAWEQQVQFSDGTSLSFLDTMRPLADAFNRLDYIDGESDPADFEDLDYGLTSIGKLVAEHYDSRGNPLGQSTDPDGMWYRRGTGISSYEEFVADLLDDGTIAADQEGPLGGALFDDAMASRTHPFNGFRAGLDLFSALEGLAFPGGEDGIDVSSRATELLLNPHAYCAGDGGDARVLSGLGACDAESPARAPLKRRDGRDFPCFSDGQCFDGEAGPRRYLAPATMAAAALHSLDANARSDERAHDALRGTLSAAVDAFAEFDGDSFASRRVRGLVVTGLVYARKRWQEEQAAGTLTRYAREAEDDLDASLEEPVAASLIQLLRVLAADPAIVAEIDALLGNVLAPENARTLTVLLSDGLELARNGATMLETSHLLAHAIATNVDALLAGEDVGPELAGSYLDTNLRVTSEVADGDDSGTLSRVLRNASRPDASGYSPLTVLTEAIFALQRVDPLDPRALDSADYRAAMSSMADGILDDRRGFERLYTMVRCATGSKVGCE